MDGLYYGDRDRFVTMCITNVHMNPWLKVDLGEEHCVMGMNLQSRSGTLFYCRNSVWVETSFGPIRRAGFCAAKSLHRVHDKDR